MTWEQEMKEQAHFLAEEWAPIMAKDLAQELAEEKAKDMTQKALEKKAIETAKNFLKNGIPAEMVAKCTELPLEQVLEL